MKNKRFLHALLLLAAFSFCGCTGQWTDDPKNWTRAFGDKPPEGVTVIHSFYRRSSYIPREQDWVFEVKLTPERRKLIFENLKLKPSFEDDGPIKLLTDYQFPWFMPKPKTNYTMWISEPQPAVFIGIFEDRQSSNVFMTAAQL